MSSPTLPQKSHPGTTSVADSLYRNKSSLEAIFRILDKDNSGQISLEEFGEACHLLHKHLPEHATEEELLDMCKMMDINKDGLVDLNEFLEAFRLCDQARRGARGRALIIGESLSLEKPSVTPTKPGAVTPLLGELVPMPNGNGGTVPQGVFDFEKPVPNGVVVTTSEVDTEDVINSQGDEGDSDESSEDGGGGAEDDQCQGQGEKDKRKANGTGSKGDKVNNKEQVATEEK